MTRDITGILKRVTEKNWSNFGWTTTISKVAGLGTFGLSTQQLRGVEAESNGHLHAGHILQATSLLFHIPGQCQGQTHESGPRLLPNQNLLWCISCCPLWMMPLNTEKSCLSQSTGLFHSRTVLQWKSCVYLHNVYLEHNTKSCKQRLLTGLHTQKAYTHSGTSSNLFLLLLSHAYMHFAWELQLDTQCVHLVYAFRSNCNKDAYMHEHTRKGFGKMNICMSIFGIRIGWRKYLNEYTPFGYVSLCAGLMAIF